MRISPRRRRAAHTLAELAVVVAILGLVTLAGLRGLHHWLDQGATRAAVAEAAMLVTRGRSEALLRRTVVTLGIDTAAGTLRLTAGPATLAQHALAHVHGVRLSATRDSIAFDVRGLGYGAANTTLIARRGSAADTLVVSRLGRTRF